MARMKRALTLATVAAFGIVTACATPKGVNHSVMQPGTLFIGGIVAAGPQQTPLSDQAIYVEKGHVVEIGSAAALRSKYSSASVYDASGATILPGLTDAHGHLYGLGQSLDNVPLAGTVSYDDVIARVKARAVTAAPGTWIIGRGWDQNDWPVQQFPTADALDAAVSDHPVWLERIDGHAGLANSVAMRAAGITATTADPDGGRILRGANGAPNGVFIDAATDLVSRAIPEPTREQRKGRILAAAHAIAADGLTEMHDAGAEGITIELVKELIDEHRFPIRAYVMLADGPQLEAWFKSGPLMNYGDRLTVRSVKLYADGALGSRGAALLQPYNDDPANRGLLLAQPEHLLDVSRRGHAAGFQVNTHAIGDRAVRNVLDAYEKAGVTPGERFRIEHLQVIAPADVPRLPRLGVIASMQPTHATSDMPWAEERLGVERAKGAYAWRTVLDAGSRLALGSDFPVEDVNPFFGIYSAVTRQDQTGKPAGGWHPRERLTLAEAVRGFTSDAAFAAFEETSRGTIEPGKFADFTIVEGDFFHSDPSQLFRTRVRATVVGGAVVYEKK
jgi:predicted amidohydrolase YtcJ